MRADRENAARLVEDAEPKHYAMTHVDKRPDANRWRQIKAVSLQREGLPSRGEAKLAWDQDYVYAQFTVNDSSAWKNLGKNPTRLFKTGDAVDIQLSPNNNDKSNPVDGDLRIVIAPFQDKPVVVLMRPIDKRATENDAVHYHSPVGDKTIQRFAVLADAQAKVNVSDSRYTVQAAIPWAQIGFAPSEGAKVRGDVGMILSDAHGTINTARVYWSNKNTNLVNDLPIEAWLAPNRWGTLVFE